MGKKTSSPILVFVDGYCNICNWSVDFLMKRDAQHQFRYASLQGKTASQETGLSALRDIDSVVVKVDDIFLVKSEAWLTIVAQLPAPWSYLRGLRALPTWALDRLYDLTARHRYRLFGKRQSCRMPSPHEKERFLP